MIKAKQFGSALLLVWTTLTAVYSQDAASQYVAPNPDPELARVVSFNQGA